ncbi:hypothetical protein AYO20_09994 [Fonsecaea nubica]|uniref:Uncharacterized protein n=1 Tax=Fonsecaea nubica TaxID=856822 RepID=A0A178CC83_9EURO|nr:hypothetical protein AYO20_09994 [Fonsecaea nubica]OAL26653.1 hypothetical protein AYO20_09994 [Fonsecaea nubica]
MDRQIVWMTSPPNELSLPGEETCATLLVHSGAQFDNHFVHPPTCKHHCEIAVVRSLENTHFASSGRDKISSSGVGPGDTDLAYSMTPCNVCLCLTDGRIDDGDLHLDDFGQLANLQSNKAPTTDTTLIVQSMTDSTLSSHAPDDISDDISESSLHQQTPEPESQQWQGQTRLTSFLLSWILSDQGQDHTERWLAGCELPHFFTLDSDNIVWKWKETPQVTVPLEDWENTGSSDMSAGGIDLWSDDKRSQKTEVTSASSL